MRKNLYAFSDTIIYAAITVVGAIAAGLISYEYSVIIGVLGGVITLISLIFTLKRKAKINELIVSIDRILHGQNDIFINKCNEGEFSILSSEIEKMTVKLNEANDLLKGDKVKLTNAIADISHQLRTPLTSINLSISLLSEEDISDEKKNSLIHNLKRSVNRIDWLVETLLKISKIDSGAITFNKEELPVIDVVTKALNPLLIPIELKNQKLLINVGKEKFTADYGWTAEAIGNIIKNCMEHTEVGGSITIDARETAIFTEITVHDSGSGFSDEDIPRLFERFYKGKSAGKDSVGIGLALSRMILSSENATIKAYNHKNGGACFEIRFYKSVI